MLVRGDGSIVGTIGGGCVEAEVWQAAREVMEQEKPRTLTFNFRNTLPEFLATAIKTSILVIFIRDRLDLSRTEGTSLAA